VSIDSILSKYKNIISTGSNDRPAVYYPTSFPSLNYALGGKGFKGGKIVQLLADNKTGKSSLAADIVSNAQRLGKLAAWVDYERTYSDTYMAKLGVDNNALLKITPPYMDTGAVVTEQLIESGEIGVIVIDSIPMAMHSSEKEKDMEDAEKAMGTSGMWTRHMKRLLPLADDTNTLVVLINQYRANTNPKSPKQVDPWGAKVIQYASSYTLEMVRIENDAPNKRTKVQIVVAKNKCAATEGYKTEIWLQHGEGFRADIDTLDYAVKAGIVKQSGAWYEYHTYRGQGKDGAVSKLPLDDIKRELETYYAKG
jgi:recombination protein RecA